MTAALRPASGPQRTPVADPVVPSRTRAEAWLALWVAMRSLSVLVAVGLLSLRPFTSDDALLIGFVLGWGAVSVAAILYRAEIALEPRAWIVDAGVALALVAAGGDWRTPFYLLALTALVLPAVLLPPRRVGMAAAGFVLGYALVAVSTGVDWDALSSTSRLESFSTHLLLPPLLMGALAYAARALDQVAAARDRTERLRLEAERRRIGIELHDSAKQRVHAAHLVLSGLVDDEHLGDDRPSLRLAIDELQAAADEMDASVAELRTALGGRPLEEALAARAAQLRQASGVRVRVHGSAPGVAMFVAAHAFRVAAEAMTNAVRHADAQLIDVAVDTDDERLRVLVTDDGRGIGDAGPAASTGLDSMRSRARALGGRLELARGAGGRGTSVLLDVPLRPDAPARR